MVLDRLEECLEQSNVDDEIYQEKYGELWDSAAGILEELNTYGISDEDKECEAAELLEKITVLFTEGRLGREFKREYMDRLFYYYDWGNSGMQDDLLENIFALADGDTDWHYVIKKLRAGLKNSDYHRYRRQLIAEIYRDRLQDEETYLQMKMASLRYGADYCELAGHFYEKGERERAVKIAEEGIDKGEGSVSGLIGFLKHYYRENGDYRNALRFYRLDFLDSPCLQTYLALKSYSKKADWPNLEKECLAVLSEPGREKRLAEVHLHEKRYDLVLKYVTGDTGAFFESKDKLADAISSRYPAEIIAYYKNKVQQLIDKKTRKDYRAAVFYLKKIKKLYKKLDRLQELTEYTVQIRSTYANRPALLEEFDRV